MPFEGIKLGGQAVDVPAILDSSLTELIAEVVVLGAMTSISTTSDGGALMLQVTLDGDYIREYFRDDESAISWMGLVVAEVRREVEARPASTAPRKRRRPS